MAEIGDKKDIDKLSTLAYPDINSGVTQYHLVKSPIRISCSTYK